MTKKELKALIKECLLNLNEDNTSVTPDTRSTPGGSNIESIIDRLFYDLKGNILLIDRDLLVRIDTAINTIIITSKKSPDFMIKIEPDGNDRVKVKYSGSWSGVIPTGKDVLKKINPVLQSQMGKIGIFGK
jgi:hypothetical protein